MGNRNRTALIYLLLKTRNHRAIGTQHVSETGSNKFSNPFIVKIFILNIKTVQITLPWLPLAVLQFAYIHFSNSFGSTHYIGRIDGFICRNEYKTVNAIFN